MKKYIILLTTFIIIIFPNVIPQTGLANLSQNVIDYKDLSGKLLIEQENIPVVNVIAYNRTDSSTNILVVYMTNVEGFILNKIDHTVNLLFNYSFGLSLTSFIWAIELDLNNNFVAALSNGSIFSFTPNGKINWINTYSTKAISNLKVLENGNFVAISDEGQIILFNPTDGTIIKNFAVNNTYFTVLDSYENIFVAGNDNGSIFVFNNTQNIFNATVGASNRQVLSVAINQLYVAAFCYNSSLSLFKVQSGSPISVPNYKNIDFNSLFFLSNNLYLSQTNGAFISYNLDSNLVNWQKNSLFINNILTGEFTGDSNLDIIATSNTGKLITLNPKNGSIEREESISDSQITGVNTLNINNDNITDLAIGTRSGEFFLYAGIDITPPVIVTGTLTHSETDTKITLSFQTNEPSVGTITYYESGKSELSISNKTLQTNHTYVITNLKANTNYTLQISITDKANNTNSKTVLVIQTKPQPPPYFVYTFIGSILLVGVVGSSYYIIIRRRQKNAFIEGERYYEAGEYILAIKSYIKANNKEKIIDIVAFLASNPQLSSFVDEIKQMEELTDYMTDIQEIIQSQHI